MKKVEEWHQGWLEEATIRREKYIAASSKSSAVKYLESSYDIVCSGIRAVAVSLRILPAEEQG